MKTFLSFCILIAVLFCACLFTGCAGMDSKEKRCSTYADAYTLYLSTTEIRPVSKEEAAAAATAAIFLRTYCGWVGPKDGITPSEDANGVPVIFPPESRASRAGPAPGPTPWRLEWTDTNNVPGSIAGYRVYRKDGDAWVRIASTVSATWPVDLPPGEHVVAVTVWPADEENAVESRFGPEKFLSVARPPGPSRLQR
jgi:hypothetical protein